MVGTEALYPVVDLGHREMPDGDPPLPDVSRGLFRGLADGGIRVGVRPLAGVLPGPVADLVMDPAAVALAFGGMGNVAGSDTLDRGVGVMEVVSAGLVSPAGVIRGAVLGALRVRAALGRMDHDQLD
jgi:hypothetical protein